MSRGKILIFPILMILFTTGCAQKPSEETRAPTKAQRKLIQLCKDDYNLDIATRAYDNTLWIYLPLEKPFLNIAASKDGPSKSSSPKEKNTIKFIDGEFLDNSFSLQYDIAPVKSYEDNKGIATAYSEEFKTKQRFLLQAITRAYSEIEQKPGSDRYVEKIAGDVDFVGEEKNATHKKLVHSYVKTSEVPDFLVLIIADTEKGIETRLYLYLQDLRRAAVDEGFGEEYARRAVSEQPIGHEVIIGDRKGSHLKTYDLSWAEFLTKQMVYRIQFKYTQSAFPPSADTRGELLKIAAGTVAAYDFTDFESVRLHDLDKDTTETISRPQLEAFLTEKAAPSKGRLIHLKFQ